MIEAYFIFINSGKKPFTIWPMKFLEPITVGSKYYIHSSFAFKQYDDANIAYQKLLILLNKERNPLWKDMLGEEALNKYCEDIKPFQCKKDFLSVLYPIHPIQLGVKAVSDASNVFRWDCLGEGNDQMLMGIVYQQLNVEDYPTIESLWIC